MAQKSINFEWRVVEDADWGPVQSLAEHLDSRRVGRRASQLASWLVSWLRIALLFGVSSIATASAAWAEQRGAPEPPFELDATVQREVAAWRSADANAVKPLLAPEVSFEWRAEWRTQYGVLSALGVNESIIEIAPAGEMMMVTLLVDGLTPDGAHIRRFRERRFYRAGPDGWLRTVPTAEFWGAPRTIETPHIRFQFFQRDAETILAVLDHSELVFVQLHHLLGSRPPPASEKLTIHLRPEVTSVMGYFGPVQPITSPWLTRVPAGMSDVDFLANTIILRITHLLMDQMTGGQNQDDPKRWRTLVWGLNGWLRSDLYLRRSPWHRNAEATLQNYQHTFLPFRLNALAEDAVYDLRQQRHYMRQYLQTEAALGYVLTSQPSGALPALLTTLDQTESWRSALPAVMQQSEAEFEAGWNRFVERHYLAESGRLP